MRTEGKRKRLIHLRKPAGVGIYRPHPFFLGVRSPNEEDKNNMTRLNS